MTPKTKAIELVDKYYLQSDLLYEFLSFIQAKECALIAIDEIIKSSPARSPINDSSDFMPHFKANKYWNEVKQEIEKL
jgi:hypothetical protein